MSIKPAKVSFGQSIRNAGRELLGAPIHNKIGLGIGITSLGLGVSNYHANRKHQAQAAHVAKVEDKSLEALKQIHTALVEKNNVK